jgi:hypothetical protein
MRRVSWLLLLVALGVSACGEVNQGKEPKAAKRDDAPPWQGAKNDPFVVKGWTQGDKASWEAQMRTRAMTQNEYNKVN